MSRAGIIQRRMGIIPCPFPFGMAEWFDREPNYIISANIPAGYYTNCTFINCDIQNAVVTGSDLTTCKFDKASVMYCQFFQKNEFDSMTVNGDLTIGDGGTLTAAPKLPIQMVDDFGTPPLTPRKSKRKGPNKLPMKLEKGWK